MFLCIAAARLPPTGGDIFHPLGKAGAALAYPEVSILLDQEAKGCVRVHPSSSFSAQNGGATEAQRGSPKYIAPKFMPNVFWSVSVMGKRGKKRGLCYLQNSESVSCNERISMGSDRALL